MAVSCFYACKKKDNGSLIIDLNGDKFQDVWETPFEKEEDSSRVIPDEYVVVKISTKEHLLNLDKSVSENGIIPNDLEEGKEIVYFLENDIDLEGEEISGLDLNGKDLYGNNKTIFNFKLSLKTADNYIYSSLLMDSSSDAVDDEGKLNRRSNIYDLNIHFGYQKSINFNFDSMRNVDIYVSPLFNCTNIENVKVRGGFEITKTMSSTDKYENKKALSADSIASALMKLAVAFGISSHSLKKSLHLIFAKYSIHLSKDFSPFISFSKCS